MLPKNKNCALIAVAALSLLCFLALAYSRNCFNGVNSTVNLWAASIQTQPLTQLASVINFFDTTFFLLVSLPVAGFFIYRAQTQSGIMLLGAMGADALMLYITKTVIVSPRPLNSLIVEGDYSFPSGHVVSALVFFGMLTYFAWQNKKTIMKLSLAALTPTLVIIMAMDRLYLNMHWLSDVLAAPSLALFVIASAILLIESVTCWYSKRQANNNQSASSTVFPNLRASTLYGRAITNTPNLLVVTQNA